MRISIEKENDITILGIKGKLDATTSKDFQEKLLKLIDAGDTQFIIDCSQLDYISSAGLRVFYLVSRKLENTNGKIVFCSPNKNIMRVFEIVDLSSDFPILTTIDDAYKEYAKKIITNPYGDMGS
ncbi:MAG: STAS domain-containing protein [Candidatus Cloacimonetes bacterium]|nr:STAS domain-containing protein [Candidatus Cloacimonadota bacterium]